MLGVKLMSSKVAKSENKSERAATKAERQESRLKRQAARNEKAATSDRPARLCSLATVEVRKGADGYQVFVSSSDGRRHFTIAPGEVGTVLKDLETAIDDAKGRLANSEFNSAANAIKLVR